MKFIQKLFILFATVVSLTTSISESNLLISQTPEITFVRKKSSNEISANNNTLSQFIYSVETTLNNKIDKYTFPNLLSSNYASRREKLLSKHNNEDLDFVFTHYKEVGIVKCDIYNGEITPHKKNIINTFIGYSTIQNNNLDVLFDFNGMPFYISEFLSNTNSNLTRDGFGEIGSSVIGISPSFYFPALITYDLLNSANVLYRVGQYVSIPNLLSSGPFSYLIYLIKSAFALGNYEQNCQLTNPTSKINNQTASIYSNWKFGFSNISSSGCGVISLFNFLLDSHQGETEVSFATIILICELCNADLGFGFLGTNMITEALITNFVNNLEEAIINVILSTYELYMKQIVDAINSLSDSIDIPVVDWILDFVVFVTGFLGDLAIDKLISTIVCAIEFIEMVVVCYVEFIGSFETIFTITTNDYPLGVYYSYQSFYSVMYTRAQGFMVFWNTINENGTINFTDGAHYVYFKRKSSSEFVAFNTSYGQLTRTSLSSLLNSILGNQPIKLITGYVVGDSN